LPAGLTDDDGRHTEETTMTYDLKAHVLEVMRNGSRIDRYVEIAADDDLFLTSENCDPAHVQFAVPVCEGGLTPDEESENADAIIAEATRYPHENAR
jgi:hypothetical protein